MPNNKDLAPKYNPKCHTLLLEDLSLQVSLGCLPEERAVLQEVRVSLEFHFVEAPGGYVSDELSDTICYSELSLAISQHIQGRPYQLIEKMAADTYAIAKDFAKDRALVAIRIHKVNPPVLNLKGGATYRCGDFN